MSARGRALRIAVLLAVAASAQAAVPRHPPRHFGRLTVARMGALANYIYVERFSAGMPGHLMTIVTHGWVHEAAFAPRTRSFPRPACSRAADPSSAIKPRPIRSGRWTGA